MKIGTIKRKIAPEDHLEVRFTEPVDELGAKQPIGYYVFVLISGKHWRALLIRFVREKDAKLARLALLRAKLHTQDRMKGAGPAQVYQVVMESLQW